MNDTEYKPLNKPIFAVKDSALQAFANPFVLQTAAQAVRSFTDETNSDPARSTVAQHPEDYDLYVIGHYNEQTGQITPLPRPELVVRAKDLIRPKGE